MSLRRTTFQISARTDGFTDGLRPTVTQGVWCSALLWWMSGAGWNNFAFGWIALTPLLWSVGNETASMRFRQGWKCGLITFALVNWWIVLAVTRGAHMIGMPSLIGGLLGVLGVVIIAVVHGLGIALVAWVWNPTSTRSRRFPFALPLVAAAVWTLFDYLRCEGVLAHSWGAPAFSQAGNLALLQSASVVGQHGLSFLCVWFAACLALWLHHASDFRFSNKPVGVVSLLVFVALHAWGFSRLERDEPAVADAERLRVLLVQTAADSGAAKMQSSFRQAYIQTVAALDGDEQKPQLVVWPETTFRVERYVANEAIEKSNEYSIGRDIDSLELRQLAMLSREHNVSILCGADMLIRDRQGVATRSNEAFLISPDGSVQRSGKTRLVPFGEQAPFAEWLPFLQNFAPQPAMVAGMPKLLRLKSSDVALGALICFESCFREPSHALRTQGAQALFVLTNDEWFGGSEAPLQHAQMCRVRAVENGLWVAQSANGGYTFAIDPHGRFFSRSRYGEPQTLTIDFALLSQ